MKALLYCTKAKPYLADCRDLDIKNKFRLSKNKVLERPILNGKIVAECDFEIEDCDTFYGCMDFRMCDEKGNSKLKQSCLTKEQLFDYVKGKNFFYAIHIKNLHIFDEPRDLSKCNYLTLEKGFLRQIKKAPQNMCYALTTRDDKDILISIRPEWLCKILNGEKTIEVRKKVLKEMLI